MQLKDCQVRISADDSYWSWQGTPMWIGQADVRVYMPGGRTRNLLWRFGGHPFAKREEAERFAYQAAMDRLRCLADD